MGKYLYWSNRRIRVVAEDYDIALDRRWLRSYSFTLPMLLHIQLGERESTVRKRAEVAARIERRLVASAGLDAPRPLAFARGTGRVSFARFEGTYAANDGALMHCRAHDAAGRRIDVCLFGSMEHLRPFRGADAYQTEWVSSEAPAIEQLLKHRGVPPEPWGEDAEYLSVEALKIMLHQGMTPYAREHPEQPWARGSALGHAGECDWFAEIYTDVVLDADRWQFIDDLQGTERILIGAPLWVRTADPAAVVRYGRLRTAARRRRPRPPVLDRRR